MGGTPVHGLGTRELRAGTLDNDTRARLQRPGDTPPRGCPGTFTLLGLLLVRAFAQGLEGRGGGGTAGSPAPAGLPLPVPETARGGPMSWPDPYSLLPPAWAEKGNSFRPAPWLPELPSLGGTPAHDEASAASKGARARQARLLARACCGGGGGGSEEDVVGDTRLVSVGPAPIACGGCGCGCGCGDCGCGCTSSSSSTIGASSAASTAPSSRPTARHFRLLGQKLTAATHVLHLCTRWPGSTSAKWGSSPKLLRRFSRPSKDTGLSTTAGTASVALVCASRALFEHGCRSGPRGSAPSMARHTCCSHWAGTAR